MARNESRFRDAERRLWESVGLAPTERRLTLPRLGTDVRIQEVGDGPTVLFVHGATNGGASWATLIARLDGFRCVALDRPGCGLSDPLPQRFDDLDALRGFGDTLVVDVLDAMGVDRIPIVGTSFGGFFSLRAAAAHPDRIDRIFELGYPFGATATPPSIRFASIPLVGRGMTALPPNERMVRTMLRRIGLRHAVDSGAMPAVAISWYLSLLRDTDTMRNEVSMGPRFPLLKMDDRALLPEHLLAGIDTPIHFLWGDEDVFGGWDVARRFVPLLPNAELELMSPAGHAPWMDDAERVATSARAFLRT